MRRCAALAAILALCALAAQAPAAGAAYDPLGSGATKLRLDKSFLALMKANGVKLSAVAPAKLGGGVVSFPVSGGKFDPVAARGTVTHEGALLFEAGARSVPLKALQLKTTQRHSPFSAKVGGSQLKLCAATGLTAARQGFGEKVEATGLTLSAKLATRLAKKLRLRGTFKAGLPLGSALTVAQPQTIAVAPKGKASLSLDPAFAAKLGSLFVAVNPIFPAEHPGAEFTLPILGGTIAPDASIGTIETEGSLELLQLGAGQVFWAENWLDFGAHATSAEVNVQPSPPYAGKAGRLAVAALALSAPALADPKARTITAQSALSLDAATAATLNEAFAKPQDKAAVFSAGEALGSVAFVAWGR